LTGRYLSGAEEIPVPAQRRRGSGWSVGIRGARANNLQNVDVDFPLSTMICVTGVSGSGKSTLVIDTLHRALARRLGGGREEPGTHGDLVGWQLVDKVIESSQAPGGRRYNRETLEVQFKGLSIADVLDLTVAEALDVLGNVPAARVRLDALREVGLEYIRLGQPGTTLSGGEAQRVKLARELARRETGRTLYVLDEPTTGLHFGDVRRLLDVLGRLVDIGNTVLLMEHNLDVVRSADHVIDLAPDGGERGGRLVAAGTPEEIAAG